MTIASRIAQTLALVLCSPFLWLWGVLMYSLVMLGTTAQSISKVWNRSQHE